MIKCCYCEAIHRNNKKKGRNISIFEVEHNKHCKFRKDKTIKLNKMVKEITIKALNEQGRKAIQQGINEDKRQPYSIMRKVITKEPLTYNIRLIGTKYEKYPKQQIIQNIIDNLLKNGAKIEDIEISIME